MEQGISISNISKKYRIYHKPQDKMKEILSFGRRKYHKEFWALRNVSFDIAKGSTVGIIGRNGSGKSTLLQVICGILTPTEGNISVNGRISALLELGTAFNPEFTGRENVYVYGSIMGLSKSEIDSKFADIESFAGIGEFIDKTVKTYSSGMYVRLAFAAAINVEPDILIVDEALAVGDIGFQRKCYRKFEEFREKGVTIILVTHDMAVIKQYADNAILMDRGKVYSIGDPNTIVNQYTNLMAAEESSNISVDNRDVETSSEYRYGSGKGDIFEFGFYNKDRVKTELINTMEPCTISYKIKFHEDIEKPIYAATIKSKSGIEIYGQNTMYMGREFEAVKNGDVKEVSFKIDNLNLGIGEYFISLGVTELVKNDIVPIDRRYDLLKFNVLPVDKSFGITNMNCAILVESKD